MSAVNLIDGTVFQDCNLTLINVWV